MWEILVKLGLSERPLAGGPRSIAGTCASLLEPIFYNGMPCSALMQDKGLGPA